MYNDQVVIIYLKLNSVCVQRSLTFCQQAYVMYIDGMWFASQTIKRNTLMYQAQMSVRFVGVTGSIRN